MKLLCSDFWWFLMNVISKYLFLEQFCQFSERVLKFFSKAGDSIHSFSSCTHIGALKTEWKCIFSWKSAYLYTSTPHPCSACRHRESVGDGAYRVTRGPRRCRATPRSGPGARACPRSPPPSSRTRSRRWATSGRRWLSAQVDVVLKCKNFSPRDLIDLTENIHFISEVSKLNMKRLNELLQM